MNRMILPGAIALAIVAGLVWWLTARPEPAPEPVAAAVSEPVSDSDSAATVEDIDTSGIVEMTLGDPGAPVTVIEYASFTCPHCARFHSDQFQKLKTNYIDTGKVHFIYRDVYFDRYGLWAALVARCGGAERFFGISDMLYTQQRDWIGDGKDPVAIADRLRRIGKVAGLGEDTLEACLADDTRAKTLVAWYQQNAEADGVESTPTLIIDGKKQSNMPYDDLKALIEDALAQ